MNVFLGEAVTCPLSDPADCTEDAIYDFVIVELGYTMKRREE